jgi:diguanylate cyclase
VRNDRMIALGLGKERTDPGQVAVLRGMADQSVEVLRDAIAVYADADYNECCTRLDAWRAEVAQGAEVTALATGLTPCLDAGREAVADIRIRQQERRREVAELIALVREAVSAAGLEHQGLRTSLNDSLNRFEVVGQFGDLEAIKSLLASEIRVMKQSMADRLQGWETRVTELGERVALLEAELLTSRHEASLDPLTHVANRRSFDRAYREWTKAGGPGFVMAVFDIDGFKAINDAFGHIAGDRTLVAVAQALKASVRSQDLVARMGGDEFVVLVADLTLRQADARLRSLVASIAASSLMFGPEAESFCTVSCGAAEFSAGDTPASVIQRADEALYEAKRGGKNRVVTKARPFVADLMKRR